MKYPMSTIKITVLLLGLLTSASCVGISATDVQLTQRAVVQPTVAHETKLTATVEVQTAVAETLTAIPTTRKAQETSTATPFPTATPSPEVVLVSFHGHYVTALGAGSDWLLRQEPDLSGCAEFTLDYLDNGKVALMTCYGRYVTAPKTGATRSDWRLWQESELDDCGQFVLYDLGRNGVAFETCAGNFITAGDGGWPGKLAWAVVGETDDILAWEQFTVLQVYIPPPPVIASFDSCAGVTERGGQMGMAYDSPADDRLVVSYVQEAGRGCIARLEYDIVGWGAFWIQLQGADLSPYSQLVFDIKADLQEVPNRVKIELKRARRKEVSIRYIEGITADWQTMSVDLSSFGPADYTDSLSSFTDMEELVFTFEANESGKTGVIYLDNITLRRVWSNQ